MRTKFDIYVFIIRTLSELAKVNVLILVVPNPVFTTVELIRSESK